MAPEVAGCERLRVLVVDDDRDAADSLAILVQLWGHDVLTEYDAASAFVGARSYRPHVVLLDIGLPRMDGHQLAREIRREAGTEAILIAVTGYADETHRSRCESAFDHYLVKPAPVEEVERLLALVKKSLKCSPAMRVGDDAGRHHVRAERGGRRSRSLSRRRSPFRCEVCPGGGRRETLLRGGRGGRRRRLRLHTRTVRPVPRFRTAPERARGRATASPWPRASSRSGRDASRWAVWC